MSHQNTRSARLAVDALETRTVPAVVSATQTFRPLVFTLQGSVSNDTTTGTGETKSTDNYTGTVTARGTVDYSSPTTGLSGTVNVEGSGRGVTSTSGGYTNTLQGAFTFADDNGGWKVVDPFTGTQTKTTGGDALTTPLGPVSGTGTFNPSNYSFRSSWTNTTGETTTTGLLAGTVYQTGIPATDLAITKLTSDLGPDRTVNVHVTVAVTGQLMKASSETAAATYLTGQWEWEDQTEDAGFEVPLSWNAGKLTADITGLMPPSWATRLVIKVDAENAIAESREFNNTSDLDVRGVQMPIDEVPLLPSVPVVSSFQMAADGTNHIMWQDIQGATIFRVPAYESSYHGPVNLTAGDINGDGVLDPVVSTGEGGGPRVRYFDGATGALLGQFMAYEEEFTGGVNIAVGDVTGDGRADIVTGTGEGGAPRVRVYDHHHTGGFVQDYFAYEESFRGGVTVAAVDLNGDDVAEVVTGSGVGGAPLIHVFDGKTGVQRTSLFAASEESREGVKVSTTLADDGTIRVTADTGTAAGVLDYRPGVPKKGESFLVLIPGTNWIDVPV